MRGELLETPAANRLHIGFFGRRNAGKSSLINTLVGQEVVIVSAVPGTTTDPVRKNIEIQGIGACTLTDTAGFDDVGDLGASRVAMTRDAAKSVDVAIMVFDCGDETEMAFWQELKAGDKAVLPIVSKADLPGRRALAKKIEDVIGEKPLFLSRDSENGMAQLRSRLLELLPSDFGAPSLTGEVVAAGEVVLLVMPQDIQAPKGRLILPQVQTIRDLLDNHAVIMSCTTAELRTALEVLRNPPDLIITDSQIFSEVYALKPETSRLTSFSILMAAFKGDLECYCQGASALSNLNNDSAVLIAEACSHAPLEEDIGRVKIPAILRQRYGQGMTIDIVSGRDYPADLTKYDLIIQCGACMFNRRYVLERIAQANRQGVPISNYGIILAALSGILDKVSLPSGRGK